MNESASRMSSNARDLLLLLAVTGAAIGGLALNREWRMAQRERRLWTAISIGVSVLGLFAPVALG